MSDRDINTFVTDLQKVGGTIFSCGFIKRTNGEYRKMVARLGVSKGIKGTGMSYDPAKKGLLTVWDMQKKAYRSIPYDGIVLLKSKGKVKIDTVELNKLDKSVKNEILATL
jgi:hypothetical protein